MASTRKKILYLNRKAPHGSVFAQESLEAILIGAAFDQDVSLAFIDDGVYQLLEGQDTSGIATKNFSATFRALGDFEVNKIYVEQESMNKRGLVKTDLMPLNFKDEDDNSVAKDSIEMLNSKAFADLIEKQDVILSF